MEKGATHAEHVENDVLLSSTVRCYACRNRVGVDGLALHEGVLLCERCQRRCQPLSGPAGDVELVG